MGMHRSRAAGAVLAASLLTGLLALHNCRSGSAEEAAERLRAAGVPSDLAARERGLDSLELPGRVGDLSWLRFPVRELTLGELEPAALATLPHSLEALQITRYSAFPRLEDLPAGLERLRIADSTIGAVGELPTSLVEIAVRRIEMFDPAALPQALQRLELADTPIRDLHSLPRSIRALNLSGSGVESLDGLPAGVAILALTGTRVGSLDPVSETLHSLELQGNPALDPVRSSDLPRHLVELALVDHDIRELDSLPGSLRMLRVRGGWDPTLLIGKLPSTLNELDLELAASPGDSDAERQALCSLPPHLESLRLRPADRIDPGCLPAGLRELYLHATRPEVVRAIRLERLHTLVVTETLDLVGDDLSELPASLIALELSYTGVRDLSRLRERLPGLRYLRCHGSIVEVVPDLPAGLEQLDLAGSPRLRSLEGLAKTHGLVALDLGGTAVRSLGEVPSTVLELDVAGTEVNNLDGVPPNLERLTIGTDQLESLAAVPESVRVLSIVRVP